MSGYDESLLKAAPEASRADRQQGYNIDLLAPERTQSPPAVTSPSPRAPSAPPGSAGPSFPSGAGETELAGVTNGPGAKEYSSISQEEGGAPHADATKTVPFWRTTKGKLLIAFAALIVIAAVVGGAVGGTSGKSSSKVANPTNTLTAPTSTTTTLSDAGADTTTRATSTSNSHSSHGSSTSGITTPIGLSFTVTASAVSTASNHSNSGQQGLGTPGREFKSGAGPAAGWSADRRRHPPPSPTRVVAGAEADV